MMPTRLLSCVAGLLLVLALPHAGAAASTKGKSPDRRQIPAAAPAPLASKPQHALRVAPMVAAGGSHALLLRPDGTLWGWGENNEGRLGLGNDNELQALGVETVSGKYPPTLLGTGYVQVAAGDRHTLALKADGSLWAWGDNGKGQLGDGSQDHRYRPVRIGEGYASVAAGWAHSFGIKSDGSLWAWGANDYGQLGDGTKTNRARPVRIGDDFTAVATGISHTVAIRKDGSLWAWGDNGFGQFGDGTVTPRDAPVQRLSPARIGEGYRSVAATSLFSAAIRNDGSLWAWGENMHGRTGDGTEALRPVPVKVGEGFVQVSARSHVLALKEDGSLWSWGYNGHGELGDGSTERNRKTPAQIGAGFRSAAAGDYFSVALKEDGSVWTWGDNWNGRLGDLSGGKRNRPAQVVLPQPAASAAPSAKR